MPSHLGPSEHLTIFALFVVVVLLFRAALHPQHMEVPRLGMESELPLPAYPQPQQCQIGAVSATYTTAHDCVGSLTH